MKDRSAWIHHNVLGDDIPYTQLSWLGKLSRTFYCSARRYGSDHQSQRAVALTYYTLFAVVPVKMCIRDRPAPDTSNTSRARVGITCGSGCLRS